MTAPPGPPHRLTVEGAAEPGRTISLEDLARLRRARDRMDRDFAQPLDVGELARAALMSSAHFGRLFRAAYSETPYSYLMTRRIERAKALLRRGDLSVTETCIAVGCTSLGSFSASFRHIVGVTPSEYRSADHDALRSIPPCEARILTRPRKGTRATEAVLEKRLSASPL
ncbi:MAG: putative AraC-family transcriptional regulator [Microbacterium sp.]|jgi:AraC-like DNA-binding protein|nr:putative AraC-family transcriptional regulator [Microbacterium sp.]